MMRSLHRTSPVPCVDLTLRSARPTQPSGAAVSGQRVFSSPPKLGAEVRFQRSPTHHPEMGIVRGRQFGTGIIEVLDRNAKPLRLEPSQYEVVTDANA